jgi:hypothetical protein
MVADSVTIAMRNCIISYLNRRRETVVQIMIERRAPLIKHYNIDKILKVDIEPYCQDFYENQEIYTIQRGIWKGEWEHYFHGIGCRLTHIQTKEYFDWDVSDPRYFDMGEFAYHLVWKMQQEIHNPNIAILRSLDWVDSDYWDAITGVLNQLLQAGVLAKIRTEYSGELLKLMR